MSVTVKAESAARLHFRPLSAKTWPALETLFGPRGASSGCWCMWWRLPRSDWEKRKGTGNKRAFRRLVNSGAPTGILAYLDGKPVGWCAVAPRQDYVRLKHSRILAAVDDQPVWSITCFFVARGRRRSGVTVQLLNAAVEFAGQHGARIVEGYPQDPRSGSVPDAFAWTGFASAFRQAGFKEVARRSPTRPVMRRVI